MNPVEEMIQVHRYSSCVGKDHHTDKGDDAKNPLEGVQLHQWVGEHHFDGVEERHAGGNGVTDYLSRSGDEMDQKLVIDWNWSKSSDQMDASRQGQYQWQTTNQKCLYWI